MTDREAVEMALKLAIDWETHLIAAQREDREEVSKSERRIKDFRRVLKRRYGESMSYQERIQEDITDCQSVEAYKIGY